jgi:hypothetical protein
MNRISLAYAPILMERKASRIRKEMAQDAERGHRPRVVRSIFETKDRKYVVIVFLDQPTLTLLQLENNSREWSNAAIQALCSGAHNPDSRRFPRLCLWRLLLVLNYDSNNLQERLPPVGRDIRLALHLFWCGCDLGRSNWGSIDGQELYLSTR